jgi:hypothetical protein
MTLEGETAIPGEWPVNRAGLFISEKFQEGASFIATTLSSWHFNQLAAFTVFTGK